MRSGHLLVRFLYLHFEEQEVLSSALVIRMSEFKWCRRYPKFESWLRVGLQKLEDIESLFVGGGSLGEIEDQELLR